MQFCSNFVPPEPAAVPGQPEPPRPAPVNSISPILPGAATISVDGSPQFGPPVRPRQIGDECASPEEVEAAGDTGGVVIDPCGPDDEQPETAPAGGAVPEGAVPVGPGGAGGAPAP